MATALREVLAGYVARLRKRLRKAGRGDVDGVHDSRTTLRRIREGMVVMGETVFDRELVGRLGDDLHGIERVLGPTRDDDVLLADLDEWILHRGRGARNDLAPLHDHLCKTRRGHARRLAQELDRGRTRRAVRRVRRFVCGPERAVVPPPGNPARQPPTLVRHFVADETWRAYEEVLAYDTRLPADADVDVIHKVRSSCRRLRYLLELFDGALPRGAEDIVDALRALQDRLGELHDHAVAVQRIEAWRADGTIPENPGIDAYVTEHAKARERLRAEFHAEWRALTGKGFRYALSHLVSGEMGGSRPDGAVRLVAS